MASLVLYTAQVARTDARAISVDLAVGALAALLWLAPAVVAVPGAPESVTVHGEALGADSQPLVSRTLVFLPVASECLAESFPDRAPAEAEPLRQHIQTTTDETGRFQVALPSPGVWQGWLQTGGELLPAWGPAPVVGGRVFDERVSEASPRAEDGSEAFEDLLKRNGQETEIQVLDSASFAAVPGALVWLKGRPACHGTSDQRGRLRMRLPVRPGESLQASAAGYLERSAEIVPEPRQTIYLQPLGTPVRGRVTGPDGQGREGAVVALANGDSVQKRLAGLGGEFEFSRPAAGRARLQVEAEGHVPVTELVEIPRHGSPPLPLLRIRLSDHPTLTGRVMSPGGLGLSGVRVTLGAPEAPIDEAVSDVEGRYSVRAHGPGTYELMVEGEGFATVYRRVEVEAGATEVDLGEVVLPWPLEVRGKVVDKDGNPLPEAEVYVSPVPAFWRRDSSWRPLREAATETSSDGVFYLELEVGRTYEVEIWKAGYRPRTERWTATDLEDTRTLTLARAVALRVLTRDESGAPLPDVEISLTQQKKAGLDTGPGGSGPLARTDSEGVFTFPAVAPGQKVRVQGTPRNLRHAPASREVLLSEEAESAEVVLVHGRAGMLTGRVVSPTGEAVAGARIEAVPLPQASPGLRSPHWQAGTVATGRYELFALPLGEVEIRVSHGEYEPWQERLVVASEQAERDFVLEPRPRGRLEGLLRRPSGEPLASVRVGLDRKEEGWRSLDAVVTTDGGGRFDFGELPAGSYRLQVGAELRLATPEAEIRVTAEPTSLEVVAEWPCRVAGFLPAPEFEGEGEPIRVHLSSTDGRQASGRLDPATGRLTLPPLYPGLWKLEISTEESTVHTWKVDCSEPGGEVTAVLDKG